MLVRNLQTPCGVPYPEQKDSNRGDPDQWKSYRRLQRNSTGFRTLLWQSSLHVAHIQMRCGQSCRRQRKRAADLPWKFDHQKSSFQTFFTHSRSPQLPGTAETTGCIVLRQDVRQRGARASAGRGISRGGKGWDELWEKVGGYSGAVGRGGAPSVPEGGSCARLDL